jgi:uncharacterized protein YcfJ
MKRTLLFIFWQTWLLPGANVFADVVTLKDGRQISGLVESGTTREVRIRVADNFQVVAVDQIQSIRFDPAATPLPGPQSVTLPIGTHIAVRTIERIDSKTADKSKEYAASLDDPVVVNGVTVIPASAAAFLRVTDLKNPKLLGRASVSLSLIAVAINGQRVEVKTDEVDSHSGSHAKRDVIAGAAAGAGIGALAGGGIGAGVGAGVGAATGAVLDKGMSKGVEIASETRFTYALTQPVEINYKEIPE